MTTTTHSTSALSSAAAATGPRVHWGIAIALTYAAFACATLGFVVFALGQPVSLVSADYYGHSLTYDQRIEATRHASALGARFGVALADAGRTAVVRLPREHAGHASGTLTWYRPSDDRADRVVPLALDAEGLQHLALDGLPRGRWLLQIEWEAQGRRYYREEPVYLP